MDCQVATQCHSEVSAQDGVQDEVQERLQPESTIPEDNRPLEGAEINHNPPAWPEPSGEGTYQEIGAVCGGQPPQPPWAFQPPWPLPMGAPVTYPPRVAPQSMGPPGMGPPGMGPQAIGLGHPGMGHPGMGHPGMAPPGLCPAGMGPPGMNLAPGFVRFRACTPPPMMYRVCYSQPPSPSAPRKSRKRRREPRTDPEVSEAPVADLLGRPYTPRASKVTAQSPSSGASDMLVEALRRGPDAALRIARTLFSKRMLTLYGWLYPQGERRDVKLSIARLWDRLPSAEKQFYLAQAEGGFGSRGGRPMVNPQLAALAGLPEEGDRDTHEGQQGETEQAVKNLLLLNEDEQLGLTSTSDPWHGVEPDDANPLGLPPMLIGQGDEGELFDGDPDHGDMPSTDEYTLLDDRLFMEGDDTLFDDDFAIGREVVLSADGDEIRLSSPIHAHF